METKNHPFGKEGFFPLDFAPIEINVGDKIQCDQAEIDERPN